MFLLLLLVSSPYFNPFFLRLHISRYACICGVLSICLPTISPLPSLFPSSFVPLYSPSFLFSSPPSFVSSFPFFFSLLFSYSLFFFTSCPISVFTPVTSVFRPLSFRFLPFSFSLSLPVLRYLLVTPHFPLLIFSFYSHFLVFSFSLFLLLLLFSCPYLLFLSTPFILYLSPFSMYSFVNVSPIAPPLYIFWLALSHSLLSFLFTLSQLSLFLSSFPRLFVIFPLVFFFHCFSPSFFLSICQFLLLLLSSPYYFLFLPCFL